MPNISFGERLKRKRIRKGMSQNELGEKMKLSQSRITQWERDVDSPSKEQKEKLERILNDKVPEEEEPEIPPGALGDWLTRKRFEKDMSVIELAKAAKLSVAAIYNIESRRILNPRRETIRKIERALGNTLPADIKQEIKKEATIEGFGEFVEFDPYEEADLPSTPGIYMLYDISQRPIYVGQGSDIKNRIRSHQEKFWFKKPIVQTAAYVKIGEKNLREKVEKLFIRFLKANAVINRQNVQR